MPTHLLFHAKSTGAICKRIAAVSDGKIVAICDKGDLPEYFDGTLIRWDSKLQCAADKTVNSADAVRLSRNKKKSRIALAGICPTTWIHLKDIRYPCVVRPQRHFGGMNFWVCRNQDEALAAIRKCRPNHWYASELIKKSTEFRVFVLGGKVFKVVRRYRDDGKVDAPWNFHNGGKSVRVKSDSWNKRVVEISVEAARRVNLDLCAVDVIVDKEGCPYVLELNTAPGLDRTKTIKKFAELLGEL